MDAGDEYSNLKRLETGSSKIRNNKRHNQQQQKKNSQQQRQTQKERSKNNDKRKSNLKYQKEQEKTIDKKTHKLASRGKTNEIKIQCIGEEIAEDVRSIASITTNLASESEETSDDSSFCRHCLRPQSELQLRFIKQRQRMKEQQQQQQQQQKQQQQNHHRQRKRSKHRQQQNRQNRHNRSKSNRRDARQGTNQILPTRRVDLNAANEEAIRFRCPQVGPQFGRDVHLPPMHFHHPQIQQQFAYQQQQQLQQYQYTHPYIYTHTHTHQHQYQPQQQQHCTIITIECEPNEQHNQNANQKLSPTLTATATTNGQCCTQSLRTKTSTAGSSYSSRHVSPAHIGSTVAADESRQQQQHFSQLPLAQSATASSDVAAVVGPEVEEQRQDREPTTPDSPSLVKVRTWYTVAKQGVSC
ncbi:transcription factor SPT20 homolog [Teleopsis dalmanni]|uniref:transcription factor SPT20 homolog n=1 Tax=Teleopsis dalmanni TaxID=139649 RepID=UPI0018CD5C18|nr:transcription factor SPT20 homolog [Teleopsis dalmanni]